MWSLKSLLGERRLSLLRPFAAAARRSGQRLYLTGGFLRDRLAGVRPKDELDLAVRSPAALIAAVGGVRGGSPFLLDKERDTWRVAWPRGSALEHLDVTRLRGPAIEDDLAARDFTVNALALDVTAGRGRALTIDPLGGRKDIAGKILRSCSPQSFRDDPLRVLRGCRFSSGTGYRLEKKTALLAAAAAPGLAAVAGERVRQELFAILQGPGSIPGLRALVRDSVLSFLSPAFRRGPRLDLRLTEACLALAGAFSPSSRVARDLRANLEEGVTGKGILLLAAFLRDRKAVAEAGALAEGLRLGGRSSELLLAALAADLPAKILSGEVPAAREFLYGLHRRWGDRLGEILILEAADRLPPARRRDAVVRILTAYARARHRFTAPSLLTGREAMAIFGLAPGRQLGGLLAAARQAQCLGRFSDRPGALAWARGFLTAMQGAEGSGTAGD